MYETVVPMFAGSALCLLIGIAMSVAGYKNNTNVVKGNLLGKIIVAVSGDIGARIFLWFFGIAWLVVGTGLLGGAIYYLIRGVV